MLICKLAQTGLYVILLFTVIDSKVIQYVYGIALLNNFKLSLWIRLLLIWSIKEWKARLGILFNNWVRNSNRIGWPIYFFCSEFSTVITSINSYVTVFGFNNLPRWSITIEKMTARFLWMSLISNNLFYKRLNA